MQGVSLLSRVPGEAAGSGTSYYTQGGEGRIPHPATVCAAQLLPRGSASGPWLGERGLAFHAAARCTSPLRFWPHTGLASLKHLTETRREETHQVEAVQLPPYQGHLLPKICAQALAWGLRGRGQGTHFTAHITSQTCGPEASRAAVHAFPALWGWPVLPHSWPSRRPGSPPRALRAPASLQQIAGS